jgi:hypothetical protein
MGPLRALQGRRKSRRVEEQFDEALLVFHRQTDDLGFRDGPVRNFLCGGNHEVADTAALELCCPLDDPQCIGRNPSFNSGCAVGFLRHGDNLLELYCTGF